MLLSQIKGNDDSKNANLICYQTTFHIALIHNFIIPMKFHEFIMFIYYLILINLYFLLTLFKTSLAA